MYIYRTGNRKQLRVKRSVAYKMNVDYSQAVAEGKVAYALVGCVKRRRICNSLYLTQYREDMQEIRYISLQIPEKLLMT